jgi:hypothetical protein
MEEKPYGGQTVTCECGYPKIVYPPTPDYTNVSLEPCSEGDSVKRSFKCNECQTLNTYYWDKTHFYSATVESNNRPHFSTLYGREHSRQTDTNL